MPTNNVFPLVEAWRNNPKALAAVWRGRALARRSAAQGTTDERARAAHLAVADWYSALAVDCEITASVIAAASPPTGSVR